MHAILDKKVKLQRPAITRDDYGSEVTDWQTIGEVWAGRTELRGNEVFSTNQTVAEQSVKWVLLYRDDVTPLVRILWRHAAHDITFIRTVRRGRFLEVFTDQRDSLVLGITQLGEGTGVITVGGSAAGRVIRLAAASGNIVVGGTGAADVRRSVSGSGAITIDGTGAAGVRRAATGTGAILVDGSALGRLIKQATGTGAITISGSGSANARRGVAGTGSITVGGSCSAEIIAFRDLSESRFGVIFNTGQGTDLSESRFGVIFRRGK